MNRKSALKLRESGRNEAEKNVWRSYANPAVGEMRPIAAGNSKYQNSNSNKALISKLPNEDYQSFNHTYMQKSIKTEVETMFILKVKARRS